MDVNKELKLVRKLIKKWRGGGPGGGQVRGGDFSRGGVGGRGLDGCA